MFNAASLPAEVLDYLLSLSNEDLHKQFRTMRVPSHVTIDIWRAHLHEEQSRRGTLTSLQDTLEAKDAATRAAVAKVRDGLFESYADVFPARSELHSTLRDAEEALCHIEVTSARGRLPVVSGTGFAFGFNESRLYILTNQHVVENAAALRESSFQFQNVFIQSCVQLGYDDFRSACCFSLDDGASGHSCKLDFVIIIIPQKKNEWGLKLMPCVPHNHQNALSTNASLVIPTVDSDDYSKRIKYRVKSWSNDRDAGFVTMDKDSAPLDYGHSGGPALLVDDTQHIAPSLYGMILGCNDDHLLLVPFNSIEKLLGAVAGIITFGPSTAGYTELEGFRLRGLQSSWSVDDGPSVLYALGPKYVLIQPMQFCKVHSLDDTTHKWIAGPPVATFVPRVLVTIPMLSHVQQPDGQFKFNDTMLDSCLASMREAIGDRRDVALVIGLNQWDCKYPADPDLNAWRRRRTKWAEDVDVPVLFVRFNWKTSATQDDTERYSQKNMPCGRFRTQILIHKEVKKLLDRLPNDGYVHIGDADIESGFCIGKRTGAGTALFEEFSELIAKGLPDIVIGGYTFGTQHTLPAALVNQMPTVNGKNCRSTNLQSAVGVQNSFLDLRMRTYLQYWHTKYSSGGNAYPTEPNLFVHKGVIEPMLSTINEHNLDWLFGPTQLEGQFFLNRYRKFCNDYSKDTSIIWRPNLAIVTEGRPVRTDVINTGCPLPLQRLLGAAAQSYADPDTIISEMQPEAFEFRTSAAKKRITFIRPGLFINETRTETFRQQLTYLSLLKVLQISGDGCLSLTQVPELTVTPEMIAALKLEFHPGFALISCLNRLHKLNQPTKTFSNSK